MKLGGGIIEINNRMKEYRIKNNLTQEEVANRLNILVSTYNMMENNKRRVSLEIAKQLEKIFNVSIDEIFFEN